MKKTITLALLAIAGMLPSMAAPVSQQRAADLALAFVAQKSGAQMKVANIEKVNDGVYLVNLAPKGFVMVSTDDNSTPVIGYSLDNSLSARQIPENMSFIIEQAADVVALESVRGTTNKMWNRIETGTMVRSREVGEPVNPLIKVNWNQGSPYNTYCPGSGNTKALVGCVAVAMSQAMSVQQYPVKPSGQVTYSANTYGLLSIDFDKETPYDWAAILSGANKYDETARLLYHAGMSVQMGYGTDGSGIPSNQVYRISNALKNHFGYANDVTYTWRSSYHGDWSQFLLNELYAGRAIVYNAIDSKGGYGHSFNIDGYDGAYFHLNWGWGGTGNGYFGIDALADAAMHMNYDSMHVAVTGIGAPNSPLRGVNMLDAFVEANQPEGTVVSALLVNGELPTAEMKVNVTGEYFNGSYREIPMKYVNGQIVTTRPISADEGSIFVRVVVSISGGLSITQGFNVEVQAPKSIECRTSMKYDRTTRTFDIHTKYGASYTLKGPDGAVLASGKVSTIPDFTFTRDQLATGTNVLEITVSGQSYKVNIVK